MEKPSSRYVSLRIPEQLATLLQRCAEIEERSVDEIVEELLGAGVKKYRFDTLEEWEDSRQMEEMDQLLHQFQRDNSFDPNAIPFDHQIIGLRQKLDALEKEIEAAAETRNDLEQLRFEILENLSLAEKEALERQLKERESLSRRWKDVCRRLKLG